MENGRMTGHPKDRMRLVEPEDCAAQGGKRRVRRRRGQENPSQLDEYQELTLLRIERNGCWLAYWGLLLLFLVQSILYKGEERVVAGEWILFVILALYLGIACLRSGIWSRRLKANTPTNLALSAIIGVTFGAYMFAMVLRRVPEKPVGSAAAGVISGAFTFFLCFGALELCLLSYRRRKRKLEEEGEEAEF